MGTMPSFRLYFWGYARAGFGLQKVLRSPVVKTASFRRFAWVVLAATLGVILWGAYVRASGSGAGCGSHWPTCNGDVIPRTPSVATLIEFGHRASSGIVGLLVAAQLVWAFRAFGRGHLVRRAAVLSTVFLATEALIGRGIVLSGLVAHDASMQRAVSSSAHLVNTFLLLGSLTLTACWARDEGPRKLRASPGVTSGLTVGLVAIIVVGMTGTVAALGDTLFPARSLAEGLASDLSSSAHVFLRIRTWHPVAAVIVACYLVVVSSLAASRGEKRLRPLGNDVSRLVVVQIAAGLLNVWLLAPIFMQLLHLLLADVLFISLVRLTAASLDADAGEALPAALPQGEPTA
jgi:cytochrome c oxidase assembly protein subunit 15